jgi:hypothetical protein
MVAVVALAAPLLPAPPPPPAPVPHAAAEPWMAEALPGVGPKTADQIAAAIRAGDRAALPARAHSAAAAWFAW